MEYLGGRAASGERGFKKHIEHENEEHRLAYAKELRKILEIESPILLDGADDRVHHQYGYMPNMTCLIDKSGRALCKANRTDLGANDRILGWLASEESD